MHDIDTTRLEVEQTAEAADGFEFTEELEADFSRETDSQLTEMDEIELATELLSVSNEAELDQFIGKLFKKFRGGFKTIGKFVKPFAGVLKGLAKKALPFVGGALGSLIPIPGVGTALGSALGGALSKALEAELEGMSSEDQEFEMARRFVQIASSAGNRLARTPASTDARAAILAAIRAAVNQVFAQARSAASGNPVEPPSTAGEFEALAGGTSSGALSRSSGVRSGRWVRRGNKIVLLGL